MANYKLQIMPRVEQTHNYYNPPYCAELLRNFRRFSYELCANTVEVESRRKSHQERVDVKCFLNLFTKCLLLILLLSGVAPTFQSVVKVVMCGHSKESYCCSNFPVVRFIMRYKVVLTFESVGEILKCDHSNESY